MSWRKRSAMKFTDWQTARKLPLLSGSPCEKADHEKLERILARYGLDRITVDEMEFSVKTRECLEGLNIRTLGELLFETPEFFLSCSNLSREALSEMRKKAQMLLENPWAHDCDDIILHERKICSGIFARVDDLKEAHKDKNSIPGEKITEMSEEYRMPVEEIESFFPYSDD